MATRTSRRLASYETPTIELNSGKEFVAFGQYNMMRNTIFVKADSPYKTIEDLKGKRIAVSGGGADAIMWRAMILKKYNLDLKLGGGDFKCNVQEFDAMPTSLDKGDIDACVGLIDYEIPYMVNGTHRWLWPDQPTGWEFYRENFDPTKQHVGVMMNLFVGQKDWVDKNPKLCRRVQHDVAGGCQRVLGRQAGQHHGVPRPLHRQERQGTAVVPELPREPRLLRARRSTWTRPGRRRRRKVVDLCKQTGTIPPEAPHTAWKIMASPADAPTKALPPSESPPSPV